MTGTQIEAGREARNERIVLMLDQIGSDRADKMNKVTLVQTHGARKSRQKRRAGRCQAVN